MSTRSNSRAWTASSTPRGEVTASISYPSPLRSRRRASRTSRWSSATRTRGPTEVVIPELAAERTSNVEGRRSNGDGSAAGDRDAAVDGLDGEQSAALAQRAHELAAAGRGGL